MKANEAPQKIWIDPATDLPKLSGHIDKDSVEYIRTEVFIEKACDAYCKVCGHYAHNVPTHICRHDCRYFSDFKKYMEEQKIVGNLLVTNES